MGVHGPWCDLGRRRKARRALECMFKAPLLQLSVLLCQRLALLHGWINVLSPSSPPRDVSPSPSCDSPDTAGFH